jgi:hypothetical protein
LVNNTGPLSLVDSGTFADAKYYSFRPSPVRTIEDRGHPPYIFIWNIHLIDPFWRRPESKTCLDTSTFADAKYYSFRPSPVRTIEDRGHPPYIFIWNIHLIDPFWRRPESKTCLDTSTFAGAKYYSFRLRTHPSARRDEGMAPAFLFRLLKKQ